MDILIFVIIVFIIAAAAYIFGIFIGVMGIQKKYNSGTLTFAKDEDGISTVLYINEDLDIETLSNRDWVLLDTKVVELDTPEKQSL